MLEADIPRVLAVRYASFVDDRQFERMGEIVVDEFSQQGPGFASHCLEEFIQNLSVLQRYSATFHLVGNQCGEWLNDIYIGETWSVASHIYEQEGVQRKLDMGIRYRDVIENTGSLFKYTSRDLNVIWTQDLPCMG